jgi:hypothetical protein
MVVAGELPPLRGDAVVGEGTLRVGLDVWAPTRWFDPRPRDLAAVDPDALAAAAQVVGSRSREDVGVDPERARSAVAALVAGDARPAGALLGDGPGLTPAGDDVVAGALAACALAGREAALRSAPELVAAARARTTALSAALLSCAAAGQVVPEAARLLAALGGTGGVAAALAELRAVGSTSGTALAVGIVAALS